MLAETRIFWYACQGKWRKGRKNNHLATKKDIVGYFCVDFF